MYFFHALFAHHTEYPKQADNSLATKQLEGRKQNKERITSTIFCNGDGSDKLPLWIIGNIICT
ncbi:tigger transposable element-derived protein [Plasmopara halstedii]|uniref:Tigger transposable element-derived protein n=1 Tax=Plasmopara halstedii TaxID=4781 RepID=A0A0P1AUT9_PLAHL|nr:tigger transposable element-derived protein [Plasmopara halstedii]CEG44831.1 tigger transposable element-derived protein [Plasmopara halstedii]|eukprot:XP_024581200.1 tigger transposable element-derived protein [Plasmopara halstedii]